MIFALPWALIAGFGRFAEMFSLAAQACAAAPDFRATICELLSIN